MSRGLGGARDLLAARPSRRAILAASAAAFPLLLSACKGVQVLGSPPPPAADIRTLRAAISAEQVMVASYDAALAQVGGQPAVRSVLTSILAEHRQHLAQLRSRLVQPPGAPGARTGHVRAAAIPPGVTATLGFLESAELAASNRLLADLPVLPPSLAQLFASISASEATHVPFLRSAGRSR
jgi:hypothetical protein